MGQGSFLWKIFKKTPLNIKTGGAANTPPRGHGWLTPRTIRRRAPARARMPLAIITIHASGMTYVENPESQPVVRACPECLCCPCRASSRLQSGVADRELPAVQHGGG